MRTLAALLLAVLVDSWRDAKAKLRRKVAARLTRIKLYPGIIVPWSSWPYSSLGAYRKQWGSVRGRANGDLHVIPLGDSIVHELDSEGACPCMPTTVPQERNDGSMGFFYSHHSLDGRELNEPDYNPHH